MNDNEIIKALEICGNRVTGIECTECPYCRHFDCGSDSTKDALALINRQKAEIEKKRQTIKELVAARKDLEILAIKEFAERLKENIVVYEGRYGELAEVVDVDCIDDLVKEMAGEINGK